MVESKDRLNKIIHSFLEEIQQKYRIDNAYLYGSFARGEIHEGSDIDILVIVNGKPETGCGVCTSKINSSINGPVEEVDWFDDVDFPLKTFIHKARKLTEISHILLSKRIFSEFFLRIVYFFFRDIQFLSKFILQAFPQLLYNSQQNYDPYPKTDSAKSVESWLSLANVRCDLSTEIQRRFRNSL